MLVLTRRIGQSLIIGDNIEIKIAEVNGKQVKVAIKAPSEVTIYRSEVYKKIQAENKSAALSGTKNLDSLFKKKIKTVRSKEK